MEHRLPWSPTAPPLMLAPMQGLTNRALRDLFAAWVRPDTVFTEFLRVRPGARRPVSAADLADAAAGHGGVPSVVQLIGTDPEALVRAARALQDAGARHLNFNLGCPYGRMTRGAAGGGLLGAPERLPSLLKALREAARGTFSVKVRAGFEDPRQVLSLLPAFEDHGVDFLVLHPRTVVQRYDGRADHDVTAEVVASTALPVVANGDVRTAPEGRDVLARTGAAGLMLGRGAVADPLLFLRLRGRAPEVPSPGERRGELRAYLTQVLRRYREHFCGERQVLAKAKEILALIEDPDLSRPLRELKRCRSVAAFAACLETLGGPGPTVPPAPSPSP